MYWPQNLKGSFNRMNTCIKCSKNSFVKTTSQSLKPKSIRDLLTCYNTHIAQYLTKSRQPDIEIWSGNKM